MTVSPSFALVHGPFICVSFDLYHAVSNVSHGKRETCLDEIASGEREKESKRKRKREQKKEKERESKRERAKDV